MQEKSEDHAVSLSVCLSSCFALSIQSFDLQCQASRLPWRLKLNVHIFICIVVSLEIQYRRGTKGVNNVIKNKNNSVKSRRPAVKKWKKNQWKTPHFIDTCNRDAPMWK